MTSIATAIHTASNALYMIRATNSALDTATKKYIESGYDEQAGIERGRAHQAAADAVAAYDKAIAAAAVAIGDRYGSDAAGIDRLIASYRRLHHADLLNVAQDAANRVYAAL